MLAGSGHLMSESVPRHTVGRLRNILVVEEVPDVRVAVAAQRPPVRPVAVAAPPPSVVVVLQRRLATAVSVLLFVFDG